MNSEGYWTGRIQALEEFLELPLTAREAMESCDLAALEARHAALKHTYDSRFKR